MKAVYIADDDKHFEDYQECVEYEKNILLEQHIDANCSREACDDAGFDILTPTTVAEYISDNIDDIMEILGAERI